MTITHSSTRIVALAAGVAVAVALSFGAFAVAPAQAAALTQAQISAIISLLQSFGADAATIANVEASLTGGTPSIPSTGGGACPALSRDLEQGSTGSDVQALQVFLNGSPSTQLAVTGAGSPGNESTYFGPITKAAVMKFQAANNVSPVAGYVGPITRAAIVAVCGTVVTPGPGPVTPTGPGITVSATAQPSNALAPLGSNRLPFTNFMVTNNTAAAVTVNSVTIERTGLGVDANFSGVVLVDSGALQIGTAKTLNSNHQASLDGFTLNPGESKSLTVAGNISSTATSNNGQIVSLKVVAINSSAPVAGSLPIVGASHTINTTLTLGSVSTTTSSFDPGSTQSKNIGDTGVRISGLRFTAGSAEDLRLYSVRWRQVGTASSVDLANVVSVVDGTSYPTTVSSDGKYYTTVFPGGLFIAKGNSIDLYNMADLVGSNSASRTVDFDIDKVTDVYFVGQTYGYGIAPSGTYQPWFDGYATTINAGTVTTIGKATEVAAQNIAANVPNQVLGGFVTDFKGEAVSVTSLPITIATSSGWTGTSGVITSISIVDENGTVVAGPVDEASTCTTGCTVTFTDTVTFPTGRHIYTVKGKLPSAAPNNGTVIVSTNPSAWTGVTGQVTGNTITISTGNFAMNTMTVKASSLVVSLSTTPSSQTIVGGGQGILLANLQLDASQSGEDVRISSVPVILTMVTVTISELNSCQVFDGSTALNTGSNVPSALAASGSATTYTFDNSMTIAKGTVKTIGLKCNIASSVTSGTIIPSISTSAANWTSTGVTSGNSITETFGNATGGTMTIGSGSMTVTVDSSSPSYALVPAGATGVTVGVIKLRATNEPITLTKLGLKLTNSGNSASTASGNSSNSGVSDLTQVYLYDAGTLVGTVTFTGTGTSATSTLTTLVTLPKDQDKTLTVKADLTNIGVSFGGGVGDVIKVDPLNAEGSGQSSGTTIQSGATAGVAGIQMYKSYPTVSNAGVSCTNSAPVCNGTAQTLKQFTVTANSAGPISLYEISVKLATTSASVTNLKLFAYTSGYGSGPANVSGTTGGQFGGSAALGGTLDIAAPTVSFVQTTPYSFTGTTYFVVTGDVAPGAAATNWSVNATILGDAATSTQVAGTNANIATTVGTAQSAALGYATSTTKNFVWSDNASTTPGITALDWFDGYYVPGLPSTGF